MNGDYCLRGLPRPINPNLAVGLLHKKSKIVGIGVLDGPQKANKFRKKYILDLIIKVLAIQINSKYDVFNHR